MRFDWSSSETRGKTYYIECYALPIGRANMAATCSNMIGFGSPLSV